MDPGALVTDVDHLKEVRVHSCLLTGTGKEWLMGAWRAGGDHHPVEAVFFYGLLNFNDTRFRTGIQVLFGIDHPRQICSLFSD
jgi:hypothetical protein